jgi:ABC-type transport system involved in multi-copper enzyme maturation permease subunit
VRYGKMSNEQLQETILIKGNSIEREKAGLKRNFTQIGNTITFEFKRNLKNFIIILAVYTLIFFLFFLIGELQWGAGVSLPSESVDYVADYLGTLFGFLILISSSLFAGSIIVEDFRKQTGNLLFPKISKTRLLIGRLISRFSLNAICISFYYVLISIITFTKYGEIPIEIWLSLIWAVFYAFTMFSFVTFMSSIMRSTATAIIVSILFLLIGFNIITMILRFAGLEFEPLFLLTYYEGIISGILSMPDPRYIEMVFPGPGGGDPITFIQWLTPTWEVAAIGMSIYSGVLLVLAYFIYKRRQSKNTE